MPGHPFPPAGPVGLSSPPSPVLWVTTTATRLSVQRSLLAPLSLPPPPLSSQRDGPEVPLPRSAFSLWWYAVNRLRWRHVALSSSRVSPLRTCPALRPRGCSAYSPYRAPNYCLLSNEKHRLSLLAIGSQVMHSHPHYTDFEALSRGQRACSLRLRTGHCCPARGVPYYPAG